MTEERKRPSAQEAKSADPLIGRILDDRYRLLSKLGQGGMGSVYLAEDQRLKIRIAVKVITSKSGDTNQIGMNRFRFEAHAAARVRGEHIVRVTDYGVSNTESSPVAYIAMEYLQGEDLSDYMSRHMSMHGPLPWSRAKTLVLEIAHGLASVHEAGLVHRDMKPSNCFLAKLPGGREQVKIFDFGIAKSMETHSDQLTREGMILGTMAYMAPEQATGKKVDGRTDIYALGAILFQMLSGRPPFISDHWHELLAQIANAPPPSLKDLVNPSSLPPHIDNFLVKSLHKNPESRFPDIASFISSIESLDSGEFEAPVEIGATELIPAYPTTTVTIPPPAPATIKSSSEDRIFRSRSATKRTLWLGVSIFGLTAITTGIWWQNITTWVNGIETQSSSVPPNTTPIEIASKPGSIHPSATPIPQRSESSDIESRVSIEESAQADKSPTKNENSLNSDKRTTLFRPQDQLDKNPSSQDQATVKENSSTNQKSISDRPVAKRPSKKNNKRTRNTTRAPIDPIDRIPSTTPLPVNEPINKPTFVSPETVKQRLGSLLKSATENCKRFNPSAAGRTAHVTIKIDRDGKLEFDSIPSSSSAVNSAADCVQRLLKGSTRFKHGLKNTYKETKFINF